MYVLTSMLRSYKLDMHYLNACDWVEIVDITVGV